MNIQTPNQPYYVILTGSKNNAGDYLIKYRAKELFKQLRADRTIIDLNAWEKLDNEKLQLVNNAKALILMGGPALQAKMYPDIYCLNDNLDRIKTPILTMGIGWKSNQGDWYNTHKYSINSNTEKLIRRINESGYLSSVRDYHTLNVLKHKGYNNFVMSGCPALYNNNFLGKEINFPSTIKDVSFSLGVTFVHSKSMEKQVKDMLLLLKDNFDKSTNFNVLFHHTLDSKAYSSAYKTKNNGFVQKHVAFAKWLDSHNIKYKDISGSAENLINHYTQTDLHIGFRVHAHIFMNSISKPSILFSEDGRGKGLYRVIGGAIFDAYKKYNLVQGLSKIYKTLGFDSHDADLNLPKDLINCLNYEMQYDYPLIRQPRKNIDNHYQIMKKFIQQLP